jgi:hypothetical protein
MEMSLIEAIKAEIKSLDENFEQYTAEEYRIYDKNYDESMHFAHDQGYMYGLKWILEELEKENV